LRVGVDARHLAGGRGVAHYTSALLAALAERFPGDEWLAFVPRGRRHSPSEADLAVVAGSRRRFPGDARLAFVAGARRRRAAVPDGVRAIHHAVPSRLLFGAAAAMRRPSLDSLLGGDVDVLWIPAPAPVAVSPGVPYVLTVHDLSWVEHPEWFTPYQRLWHRAGRLERLAARATRVVAVSHATRRALLDRWPSVQADRVRVVHSGVRRPHADPGPLDPGLPDRFFLAVGALEPRKAPELIARAHDLAAARGLDAPLVFAGEGRRMRRVMRPGVRVLHPVGDALRDQLYRRALALLMPSLDEGFAFPPLEAASVGTPSIVRDLPVYDETLGSAAVRVGGGAREWAEAMLALARDDARRATLGEAAREAAARFTWERAADQLYAVLREAAAR
jgi:glycosyltransferase involved in cell wall biosynthesis